MDDTKKDPQSPSFKLNSPPVAVKSESGDLMPPHQQAPASRFDEQKENMIPTKRGRTVNEVENILHKRARNDQSIAREKIWHSERVKADPDNFKVWSDFIDWARVYEGDEAKFTQNLVEKCLQYFSDAESTRQSLAYLKLWTLYADYFRRPDDIFKYMIKKRIAIELSAFYEHFATVYEMRLDFLLADEVYQAGLKLNTLPANRLAAKYKEFQTRYAAYTMKTIQTDKKDAAHPANRPLQHALKTRDALKTIGGSASEESTTTAQSEPLLFRPKKEESLGADHVLEENLEQNLEQNIKPEPGLSHDTQPTPGQAFGISEAEYAIAAMNTNAMIPNAFRDSKENTQGVRFPFKPADASLKPLLRREGVVAPTSKTDIYTDPDPSKISAPIKPNLSTAAATVCTMKILLREGAADEISPEELRASRPAYSFAIRTTQLVDPVLTNAKKKNSDKVLKPVPKTDHRVLSTMHPISAKIVVDQANSSDIIRENELAFLNQDVFDQELTQRFDHTVTINTKIATSEIQAILSKPLHIEDDGQLPNIDEQNQMNTIIRNEEICSDLPPSVATSAFTALSQQSVYALESQEATQVSQDTNLQPSFDIYEDDPTVTIKLGQIPVYRPPTSAFAENLYQSLEINTPPQVPSSLSQCSVYQLSPHSSLDSQEISASRPALTSGASISNLALNKNNYISSGPVYASLSQTAPFTCQLSTIAEESSLFLNQHPASDPETMTSHSKQTDFSLGASVLLNRSTTEPFLSPTFHAHWSDFIYTNTVSPSIDPASIRDLLVRFCHKLIVERKVVLEDFPPVCHLRPNLENDLSSLTNSHPQETHDGTSLDTRHLTVHTYTLDDTEYIAIDDQHYSFTKRYQQVQGMYDLSMVASPTIDFNLLFSNRSNKNADSDGNGNSQESASETEQITKLSNLYRQSAQYLKRASALHNFWDLYILGKLVRSSLQIIMPGSLYRPEKCYIDHHQQQQQQQRDIEIKDGLSNQICAQLAFPVSYSLLFPGDQAVFSRYTAPLCELLQNNRPALPLIIVTQIMQQVILGIQYVHDADIGLNDSLGLHHLFVNMGSDQPACIMFVDLSTCIDYSLFISYKNFESLLSQNIKRDLITAACILRCLVHHDCADEALQVTRDASQASPAELVFPDQATAAILTEATTSAMQWAETIRDLLKLVYCGLLSGDPFQLQNLLYRLTDTLAHYNKDLLGAQRTYLAHQFMSSLATAPGGGVGG